MQFDLILADPAWTFKTYSAKGKGKSPERHYPTMTIEDICNLPVARVAAPNCVLFLWVTWPTLFEYAPRVIDAWGFEYKTQAFTWAKTTKRGIEKLAGQQIPPGQVDNFITKNLWFMGTGYYTRANSEPCLLCVRKGGRARVADRGVSSLIVSPIGRHSQKPDEQYNRINRLYPQARKLELFARQARPGWVALGNEVNAGMGLNESIEKLAQDQGIPGSQVIL